MRTFLRAVSVCVLSLLLVPAFAFAATITQYLEYGSSGSQVTLLQQVLIDQGYLSSTPTGYFGTYTRLALLNYQRAKGILTTGTVGTETRAALNKSISNKNQATINALLAQIKILQAKLAELLAARANNTSATTTPPTSPSPTPTSPSPTPTPTPTPTPPTPTPTPPAPSPSPTPPPTDTVAPSITVTAPSGNLSSGTTQVSLTVITNENASCAYHSVAGAAFASMITFTSTGGTSHSTTLSSLSSGTTYTRYIRCKDVAGNISSDASAAFAITAVATPTPTPSPTAASADGTRVPPASQIVDASGTVWTISGNRIMRNGVQASGGLGSIITWCGSQIRVFGTDSNWWAWNGSGWGNIGNTDPCGSSNPTGAADTSAPSQPTGFGTTAMQPTSIAFRWNAASDNVQVTGYRIFRNNTAIGTTQQTTYTDATVTASTTYSYYVRAYDAAGNNSTSSITVTVTTPGVAQVVPVNGAVNIRTDFGAACNGTADDSAAFMAFQQWALNWQVSNPGLIQLDIPSGATCVLGPNGATTFATSRWTVGIKKFLMKGYGATFKGNSFLGGLGQYQDNAHSARVATVNAGSNSVTLLDASKAALFIPGRWVLVSGYDLQGLWNAPYGYPSNPHFFEYMQIASVSGSTVTFNSQLKNSYKSTWPNYNGGNVWEIDNGGPATIYALQPSWDTEVEYQGITFNFTGGQTYANGRTATFRDVKLTSGALIPTASQTWSLINSDLSGSYIEVDKLVSTLNISNSTIYSMDFQSSSVDQVNMDNSRVINFMNGTPKKFVGTNNTFNGTMGVGTLYYGRTESFSCTNCTATTFTTFGYSIDTNPFSMANGIISVPNTAHSLPWAVPNTWNFWSGSNGIGGAFKVVDVTQDASNTYVHTNLTGSWPTISQYIGQAGRPKIVAPAAQSFTCTNCTGDAKLVDITSQPAGTLPYSYAKKTYSGNFKQAAGATVRGRIVSIKINVTKPYTGTRATLPMNVLGQFGNFVINSADGSSSRIDPIVNVKVAGQRVITPTGVTGNQAGDDFTKNADASKPWKSWDIWINDFGVSLPDIGTEDPSTWPSVTIEVITDQGIGAPIPPSTL